jgi:beta-lactamase class A
VSRMGNSLLTKLEMTARKAGVEDFAVVFRPLGGAEGVEFSHNADQVFHAASTIKVALLAVVFRAVEEGRFALEDRLHVRNRFFSVVDGSPFALDADRDGDAEVYGRIGRTMPIGELAKWMIITSSNLATNLLLEFVGLEYARGVLAEIPGVELRRGVEDHLAFDQGINNEVTAAGLTRLWTEVWEGRLVSESSREGMLEILFQQKFNDMIPAGLPESARVAHKTGEISNMCHDTGLVFLEARNAPPVALTILTKCASAASTRREAVADMAREIHKAG